MLSIPKWLQEPGPAPLLDQETIARRYPRLRFQVFMGIFLGYAGFYLIRNNISAIAPLLKAENGTIDKAAIGVIANAVLFSYGLSKFFSAMISDRSNARYFLPLGLALSAIMNLLVAFVPWVTASVGVFATVMFINGWFQGMGWPPCGRMVTQWFSTSERAWKGSLWNTSHNLGAGVLPLLIGVGLAITNKDWRSAYWLPAVVTLIIALIAFLLIRDNPPSQGLPRIEEFRNDPDKVTAGSGDGPRLSTRELVLHHILGSRIIISLAIANVFVYAMRYGVLNWITTYLSEKHHMSIEKGLLSFAAFEMAGFLGMIGLQALDLSPRDIAGTAAGFTGLFGYLLGATLASSGVGFLVQHAGWNVAFITFLVFAVLVVLIFLMIGRDERAVMQAREEALREAQGQ